jgi:hypothetical protein
MNALAALAGHARDGHVARAGTEVVTAPGRFMRAAGTIGYGYNNGCSGGGSVGGVINGVTETVPHG